FPARWVGSRWVWQFTSPGTRTASGTSRARASGGAATWEFGPIAAMRPAASTRTAPSSMGGAVTGYTERARRRSIRGSRRHADVERRVHGARLRRLGAGIEPVPMAYVL